MPPHSSKRGRKLQGGMKAWDLIRYDFFYSNETRFSHQCLLCPHYVPGTVQCQALGDLSLFPSRLFEGVSLSISLRVRV